jgi:hypothetical protein
MDDYSTVKYIQPFLQPKEKILWIDKPGQGIRFQPSDKFLIPFSLLCGGFAIFWETMVFRSNGPVFMMLWGLPFILVGLYIMVGRFFWDAHIRSKQIYAPTDKRLMVIKGKSIQSNGLSNLPQLTLNSRSDGTGSISFVPLLGRPGNFGAWSPAYLGTSFLYLQNANEVYSKILDAQSNAMS